MEYKEFQVPPLTPQDKAKAESIINRMRGPYSSALSADMGISEQRDMEVQGLEQELDKTLHVPENSRSLALNYEDRKKFALDHWSTSGRSEWELYRGILSTPDLFSVLFAQASPEVQEAYQRFIRDNKLGYRPNPEDKGALYRAIDEAAGINLTEYEESKLKARRESETFYGDLNSDKPIPIDELIGAYIKMLNASLAQARLGNWILEKRYRYFDQLASKAGLKIINVPHKSPPEVFMWIEKYEVDLPKEAKDEIQEVLDRLHEILVKGNSGMVKWTYGQDAFDAKFGDEIKDAKSKVEEILESSLPEDKRKLSDGVINRRDYEEEESYYYHLLFKSPPDLVEKLLEALPKIKEEYDKSKKDDGRNDFIRYGDMHGVISDLLTYIQEAVGLKAPNRTILDRDRIFESIMPDADDVIAAIVARNVHSREYVEFKEELRTKRAEYFTNLVDSAGLKVVLQKDGKPLLKKK